MRHRIVVRADRLRTLGERLQLQVVNDSDNGEEDGLRRDGREIVEVVRPVHPAADRILIRPEPLRQLFVDDDRPRPGRAVAFVEEAAARELRAHRFEISRRDVDRVGRNHRLALLHLVSLGKDDAVAVVAAEWNLIGCAHRRDARKCPQPRERRVCKRARLRIVVVSRARQADRRRQHAVGVEAGIDGKNLPEARKQQARANEQHERERDLRDDERAPE